MNYIFDVKMKLNERIRTIRQGKGYTQEYMAEKLGIDTVNYGRIERGQTQITIERLSKIANILNVEVSELLLDSNYVFEQNKILKKMLKTDLEILKEIKKLNIKLTKNQKN